MFVHKNAAVWALRDKDLKPHVKYLLLAMSEERRWDKKINAFKCTCTSGEEVLAAQTGYTVRQVRRLIVKLTKLGYIQETTRGGKSKGRCSEWQINVF